MTARTIGLVWTMTLFAHLSPSPSPPPVAPPRPTPEEPEASDTPPLSPRLQALRKAIEEGRYRVDAEAIAKKLVGE